ncbi:M20/M25/M40 family metallo-hydrolase [Marinilabiliaceae bacterium JC017]|nr:M20/M25/M40 family metallo-hydrolase [Marinilabiliaceae bacterium JC017]
MTINQLVEDSIGLLKKLISIPALSREEDHAADLIQHFLEQQQLKVNRRKNNIWVESTVRSANKPTILLNSHIDTVRPSDKWTRDPFSATEEDGKLYGLGSNDAGASLVSLMAAFLYLNATEQPYNLIFVASAEEEVSGNSGVASILEELGPIDLGIVGEPTLMQMAVAEKGLLVLDCEAKGKAGHAARHEGVNAIYEALPDIEWFRNYQFPKVSDLLGPVQMTVTQVEAGSQHNVVPDSCRFVVDIRVNEHYSNKEMYEFISEQVKCQVTPRSFRINSSSIALSHSVVKRGKGLGMEYYGSPTTSDQAVMPFTTLKIGPGDSARSHTADEYVLISEIEQGVRNYIALLSNLNL